MTCIRGGAAGAHGTVIHPPRRLNGAPSSTHSVEILVMGAPASSQAVGAQLLAFGHELTLFNPRQEFPFPAGWSNLAGVAAREALAPLAGRSFDVINRQQRPLLAGQPRPCRENRRAEAPLCVFVSSGRCLRRTVSSGPQREPAHRGPAAACRQALKPRMLRSERIPSPASGPTYTFGPGKTTTRVESWFFDRIVHGRPCLPGDASTIPPARPRERSRHRHWPVA